MRAGVALRAPLLQAYRLVPTWLTQRHVGALMRCTLPRVATLQLTSAPPSRSLLCTDCECFLHETGCAQGVKRLMVKWEHMQRACAAQPSLPVEPRPIQLGTDG